MDGTCKWTFALHKCGSNGKCVLFRKLRGNVLEDVCTWKFMPLFGDKQNELNEHRMVSVDILCFEISIVMKFNYRQNNLESERLLKCETPLILSGIQE